jgi:hypothetical protein
MATASKRRRHEDRFSRTSTLTHAEVASAETTPNTIPSEYHGMINLLKWYVKLLQRVVGPRCGHSKLVLQITAKFNAWQHIFEALTAQQIASLLWQIFMDARRLFSTGINGLDNLPQTLLQTIYNEVAAGIVQVHLNTPYTHLLGKDAEEVLLLPGSPISSSMSRHPSRQPSAESSPSTRPSPSQCLWRPMTPL